MTSPLKPPVVNQDCLKLEVLGDQVSDGNTPKPVPGSALREMMGPATGGRRLSIISEQEPDKPDTDPTSLQAPRECGGSSFSVCSDKFKSSSSHFSSDDSYQPCTADDCAGLLLACLDCRFLDLMAMLPDTCERAVSRCFPSYAYIVGSGERDEQGADCCDYTLELDCNVCGSCQDAGELVELAMEISEVCYR